MGSPIPAETSSSRRIAAQGLLALGAAGVGFGAFEVYEGKPASPSDGVLARALLIVFEPQTASFVAGAFLVAFGVAMLVYGLLRYQGKA